MAIRVLGIPVASGSYDVTSIVARTAGISGHATKSTASGFEPQWMVTDLLFSKSIKDWSTIRGYSHDTSSIKFHALVGYLRSYQRYCTNQRMRIDSSLISINSSSSSSRIAKVVPSHVIGVHDYLHINCELESFIRNQATAHHNSTWTAADMSTPSLSNAKSMRPSSHRPAWSCHVTLLDLQLSPDILDLYTDRSIVVTAGCGGASSFTTQTYLGHITNYMGSFVEKAEMVVPSHVDFLSLESKIYRSCLHVEVKVVEDRRQLENSSPSRISSMTSGGSQTTNKSASISSFVLCTGLLQKDSDLVSHPNNDTSSEGSTEGLRHARYVQLMDTQNISSIDNVSSTDTLDTGEYDVLLYTSYNAAAKLEAQLVGAAKVRVEVDGVHRLRACIQELQDMSPVLHNEFDQLIYHCNDGSERCSHFRRCADELVDFSKMLSFVIYVVVSLNKLMDAHREAVANSISNKGLTTELEPSLQIHMNSTLAVYTHQRNKLFSAMGCVLAIIGSMPGLSDSFAIDIVTQLVDGTSSSISRPGPAAEEVAASPPGPVPLMRALQKYFQVLDTICIQLIA